MGVTVVSVLVPEDFLAPETKELIMFKTLEMTVEKAREDTLGKKSLTVRDLLPQDIGFGNQAWNEQTGTTSNAYEDSQVASDSIADDTWIGICGVQDQSTIPSVSALRWDVGGTRVAQWNISMINSGDHPNKAGLTLSPIIVSRNKIVTIQHYIRQGGNRKGSTELAYIGYVVELEGLTLRP
jgi:hypothetical protein